MNPSHAALLAALQRAQSQSAQQGLARGFDPEQHLQQQQEQQQEEQQQQQFSRAINYGSQAAQLFQQYQPTFFLPQCNDSPKLQVPPQGFTALTPGYFATSKQLPDPAQDVSGGLGFRSPGQGAAGPQLFSLHCAGSPFGALPSINAALLESLLRRSSDDVAAEAGEQNANLNPQRRKRSMDSSASVGSMASVSTESVCSDGANQSSGDDQPHSKRARRAGKLCSVAGCTTRDKGGGRCAKHGGGRPCKFNGCDKIVAGVRYCSQHGGTRKKLCSFAKCTKGDQGGGFCASHGGGRRCKMGGCSRRDIGRGLCWSHGGGRRCAFAGCLRCPSQEGYCKVHLAPSSAQTALTLQ